MLMVQYMKTTISQRLIQSKTKFEGRLRYFATEGTHIEIDIHDQNELNTLKQIYKNYYHKTPKGYISAAEIVEAVLGKSAVYFCLYMDNAHSINLDDASDNWYQYFDIDVYPKEAFSEVPLTKGEQEKLKVKESLDRKASFHALVAKDVLVTTLNEHEYQVSVSNNRYLYFTKVKGWNKLIKEALEYYLNNEVLKDTGCKITIPKVRNQHKYNYNDYLCDLGEIELDLK